MMPILAIAPPRALRRDRITMSIVRTARQEAQGLVEYGLIIALVAVLAIAGLIIFGPAVSALLSRVGGSV
jgi:Flp pilus assembly pilin Flp